MYKRIMRVICIEHVLSITMITDKIENFFGDIMIAIRNLIPDINRNIIQLLFMIVFVVFVIVFYGVMSNDKQALGENFIGYLVSFASIILIGCAIMFMELKDNNIYFVMGILVFAVIILIFSKQIFSTNAARNIKYFFFNDYPKYSGMSKEASFAVAYSLKMLLVSIILLAMVLFYRFFLNQSYRQKGIIGFVIQFIFYIPCLLNDYFNYLAKEFQMTPFVVYVLLGIELLFIALYFLLPFVFSKMSLEHGKQILKKPIFVHNQKVLDSCRYIMNKFVHDKTAITSMKNKKSDMTHVNDLSKIQNLQYAFSMWISVNEPTQLIGNEAHTLFRYDDEQYINDSENEKPVGKPCIYLTNDNQNGTQYNFVFSDMNPENMTFTTTLPAQKWNHIVFNYSNSRCDLFLNGKLTKTMYFKDNSPNLTQADNLTIGQESDKVVGAICNVVVFKKPMTPEQIAYVYNINHLRNPPV